jgi:transitional endoplasmic reticulum ATPase
MHVYSFHLYKVLSTLPDTPVIITPATRIIYQEQQQEEAIDQLETQLKQITISDRLTGLEKAYNQLYEVVSYPFLYKNWIERLGIECPKGVLLYGPPGVGKTYLVSMVASACNAKMFIIQGPEIFGPYLGESEERLRSKFMEARTYAEQHDEPVILFMDEIVSFYFGFIWHN